jgi:hypothetical protein
LLREYFSAEMGTALRQLRDWRQKHEPNFVSPFIGGLSAPDRNNDAVRLDEGARRHVSQFFTRLRVLCEADLVERRLVGEALGREPFDFFVMTVEQLDSAQRTAYGRPVSTKNRDFFTGAAAGGRGQLTASPPVTVNCAASRAGLPPLADGAERTHQTDRAGASEPRRFRPR